MADRPHDALFKQTFSDPANARAELRAVLPAAVVSLFDWDSLRLESGSFVDVEDHARHCDLLFSIALRDDSRRALVFVLFEHQSTHDARMPLRVLGYMVRIWDAWARGAEPRQSLPPIVPVVLSHSRAGWPHPTRFEDLVHRGAEGAGSMLPFTPKFELVIDDIAHTSDTEIAARSLPPASALALYGLARRPRRAGGPRSRQVLGTAVRGACPATWWIRCCRPAHAVSWSGGS